MIIYCYSCPQTFLDQTPVESNILWNKISKIVFTHKSHETEKYIQKYRVMKQRRLLIGKFPFIFSKVAGENHRKSTRNRKHTITSLKAKHSSDRIDKDSVVSRDSSRNVNLRLLILFIGGLYKMIQIHKAKDFSIENANEKNSDSNNTIREELDEVPSELRNRNSILSSISSVRNPDVIRNQSSSDKYSGFIFYLEQKSTARIKRSFIYCLKRKHLKW